MGLRDGTGQSPLRRFAHVKVTRANHHRFGQQGTVIRANEKTGKVWVIFPDGNPSQVDHRALEVIVHHRA